MGTIIFKELGLVDYEKTLEAMQAYTATRTPETPDEIWFCEHPPVFTQGRFGEAHHLLKRTDIPVVHTDRGGQVTYHGPGQLIAYCLIDLKRHALSIKAFVCLLERTVIQVLRDLGINAHTWPERPGVYIENQKICSLGLRVRRGCTYHGLALNIDMDLSPFSSINPCGYADQKMTHVKDWNANASLQDIQHLLKERLKLSLL